ncbi:phage tail protein [Mesorhizobium sp. ANAO-SY3R2]|uniref:phage tail protein n=1 Tax=Mesorhizobium sp. ANAO-SY3R2 TaxID=3166644 RepID=UPI00366AD32C
MKQVLLPKNATKLERAVSETTAPTQQILEAVEAIRVAKHVTRPPSFLPWLIDECGLEELTPYLPNLYELLDEGVAWQRIRGTPMAVAKGLGWLGYTAAQEEASPNRRYWNSFQLRFPSLPANDDPDLSRIEGISTLSVSRRSRFRRGVHRYDIKPLELDYSRLDQSMLEFESGVAATPGTPSWPGQPAIWSFGRLAEFDHTLSQAEGEAIGNWIDPPVGGGSLAWEDMTYPWEEATFAWEDSPEAQRQALMAGWFAGRPIYLCLRAAGGAVIGYRLCRAVRPVGLAPGGAYRVGGAAYDPSPSGTRVYIEAMTQFEDADDVAATSISLLVNAVRAPGVKPGKQWLTAAQLSGGQEFAQRAVTIPLRRTVRDQFKFLVRF